MTLTQIATELDKPDLLNDITMPRPREAVRRARTCVLDLKDVLLAAELYLEHPSDISRQLLTTCIENAKGRTA